MNTLLLSSSVIWKRWNWWTSLKAYLHPSFHDRAMSKVLRTMHLTVSANGQTEKNSHKTKYLHDFQRIAFKRNFCNKDTATKLWSFVRTHKKGEIVNKLLRHLKMMDKLLSSPVSLRDRKIRRSKPRLAKTKRPGRMAVLAGLLAWHFTRS